MLEFASLQLDEARLLLWSTSGVRCCLCRLAGAAGREGGTERYEFRQTWRRFRKAKIKGKIS